ncbi:MAG: hypothetical protein ABL951_04175 [Alphaproteobacteria bacterium]
MAFKPKHDWIQAALALLAVLGFFGILTFIFVKGLNQMETPEGLLVATLVGYCASEYKTVYNYYFGSSTGSKQKTEMMDTMMKEKHE